MSQQTISRYHILESIGRGGMATVYRAFDPMFKRDVAVKVMAGEHLTDKMLRGVSSEKPRRSLLSSTQLSSRFTISVSRTVVFTLLCGS